MRYRGAPQNCKNAITPYERGIAFLTAVQSVRAAGGLKHTPTDCRRWCLDVKDKRSYAYDNDDDHNNDNNDDKVHYDSNYVARLSIPEEDFIVYSSVRNICQDHVSHFDATTAVMSAEMSAECIKSVLLHY